MLFQSFDCYKPITKFIKNFFNNILKLAMIKDFYKAYNHKFKSQLDIMPVNISLNILIKNISIVFSSN